MQTKLTETPAKKEMNIAEELAKKQREISVAEFFTKNRHLLGFDNPRKSLLTSIKEACDNSLDATEEAKLLPDIIVEVKELAEDRYKIAVEDNGPGIVKEQVPRVFGKLLYGSKFHRYRQSLTADEPIIIKQENKIKILPIGELIDLYLQKEGDIEVKDLEVPCFDWKTYKYSFKPVSHLIKHKRENEIYKLQTKYGKQIKVTGCHSLFTINKDTLKVEEVEARSLKEGDLILAPRTLNFKSDANETNLLEYLADCKEILSKSIKSPLMVPLTSDVMKFIALGMTKGKINKKGFTINIPRDEREFLSILSNVGYMLGIDYVIKEQSKKNSIQIIFSSKFLGLLFKNKMIPGFIFTASKELRQDFLDTLYRINNLTNLSKDLANHVIYLYLLQGINASLGIKGGKYTISFLEEDSNCYPLANSENTFQLSSQNLQALLQSDFRFLPIKKIDVINKGYKWVYDLSVPQAENFVGGFGALSCHNSRGQQGIGISAVNLFSQLTTGKPMVILSKIGKNKPAVYMELQLNTKTNEPEIIKQETREWDKDHGVRVEFEIEAKYVGGKQSVDEYLKNTAIANPHALIKYKAPDAEWVEFPRAVTKLPKEPKEIQPHPYGIELGMLITKLKDTKARTLKSFLETEFSRVSANVAKEICEKAKLEESLRPEKIDRQGAEQVMAAIKTTKIMAPPTDCLSPIGEDALLKGLRKEVDADFYAAVTRPPAVYRGNPFQIEVAVAFGGAQPTDDLIRLVRFANRVPLLYQQSACVTTKSVIATAWKNYGVSQSRGALPSGPITLVVHMASVWVPFTSESKEAMASYPEIMHEMKLAIQEVGRRLASHVRKIKRVEHEKERKKIFELYVEEVAESLKVLTKCSKEEIAKELLKYARKQTLSEEEEQQLEDIKKKKSQAVKRSEVDE